MVTVGTIHSVKGGQADVVFLSPDVSGAGMKEWQGNATARSHIYRLFYVGMTRARETIVVLSSGGRTAMRF
jgi:superfamily I DNA/RNA helicase